MQLAERLDHLRQQFPACRVLAYADISAGMVLCASTEQHLRQEHLDALCSKASKLLNGNYARSAQEVLGQSEDPGIFQAATINDAEISVFIKSEINSADVLCCVCAPTIELGDFTQEARDVFMRLEQEA